MYGNTESMSDGGYMKPGIHTVALTGLEVKKIEGNWNGIVADLNFKNNSGETINTRIFEFNFEEGKKNYKGEVLDAKTQWNQYQDIHVATFKYACDVDKLKEALSAASDFKSWAECFKLALVENGGRELEVRIVGDKKGFSKYYFNWDSAGEAGSGTVKFDPTNEKHTGPKKEEAPEPIADNADDGDELPF